MLFKRHLERYAANQMMLTKVAASTSTSATWMFKCGVDEDGKDMTSRSKTELREF